MLATASAAEQRAAPMAGEAEGSVQLPCLRDSELHCAHLPDIVSERIIELSVVGMTCENCVRHVGDALRGVPGVSSVHVSLEDALATVGAREGSLVTEELLAAVERAGYEPRLREDPEADH